MLASSVPTVSTVRRRTRAWRRAARRRTARPDGRQLRQQERRRISCGQRLLPIPPRSHSVRRPSFDGRDDCAARAPPMPGNAASSSRAVRARPCRPPTAAAPRWRARARRPWPSRGRSPPVRCRRARRAPTRSSFSRGRSCGARRHRKSSCRQSSAAVCPVSCPPSLLFLAVHGLVRSSPERDPSGAGRRRSLQRRRR